MANMSFGWFNFRGEKNSQGFVLFCFPAFCSKLISWSWGLSVLSACPTYVSPCIWHYGKKWINFKNYFPINYGSVQRTIVFKWLCSTLDSFLWTRFSAYPLTASQSSPAVSEAEGHSSKHEQQATSQEEGIFLLYPLSDTWGEQKGGKFFSPWLSCPCSLCCQGSQITALQKDGGRETHSSCPSNSVTTRSPQGHCVPKHW